MTPEDTQDTQETTDAAAPGAGDGTPEAPESEGTLAEPTPEEVMGYDPFAVPVDAAGQPVDDEAAEAPAETPVATAARAVAPKAPPEPTAPPQPAPIAPKPAGPTMEEMVALNQQLLQRLNTLEGQAKPPPQAPPAAPEDVTPEYGTLTLPPELQAMLTDADPAKQQQGLLALAQGLAQIVHTRVRQEYRDYVGKLEPQIAERVQTQAAQRSQAETIFRDFYADYPQLNRPELRQLVSQAANAVVKEQGGNPSWSPALKKQIGERVFSILGQVAPPAAPAETGAPARRPAAQPKVLPPKQRGLTNRPSAPPSPPEGSQEQHMQDVLNVWR